MATAGKTALGASEDFDGANDGDINGPYFVGAGSTITEYHVSFRSGDGLGAAPKCRPMLYRDNSTDAGALIATLDEIAILASDTVMADRSLTGLSVVSPVDYIWLGEWWNNTNHRYAYDSPGGTPGRYKSSLAVYASTGDSPDPWPASTDVTSGQEHTHYIVYTLASSYQPRHAGSLQDPTVLCAPPGWVRRRDRIFVPRRLGLALA